MCKLSNFYVVDLVNNITSGGIEWNVANSLPQLMNNKCKIVVKQMQTEIKDGSSADISDEIGLRVIHNMNIQSGYNNGSSNSNILAYIDTFQIRTYVSNYMVGFTSADCILYAPSGLPAVLSLQRMADSGLVDSLFLSWSVRLEITVNPDQD